MDGRKEMKTDWSIKELNECSEEYLRLIYREMQEKQKEANRTLTVVGAMLDDIDRKRESKNG